MIGIAAVFGAVSIFVADIWIKGQANARAEIAAQQVVVEAPRQKFGTIVVAKAPLRFGMPLTRDQLEEIPWPQGALPEGAFATMDELLSQGERVVLSPIERNEPMLLAKLSGPDGRATLSNLLTPGMRAVTVRTDEIAGVGGFITPGDRVDVVLTRDAGQIAEVADNATGAAGSTITTEIVVENVKVLTVGQGADTRQTTPQVTDSVTIEVTAEGAQKIALARSVGQLSLMLRAATDAAAVERGVVSISAFGGSVASKAGGMIESISKVADMEPEEPRLKTVIVTRGTEPRSYQVISGQEAQAEGIGTGTMAGKSATGTALSAAQ